MAAQASLQPDPPRRHRQRSIAASIVGASALYLLADAFLDQRSEFMLLAAPSGHDLRVEIARTSAQRAKGLSGRSQIGADGLLLVWSGAGEHPIWMAGMRFPLDLVWLDVDDRVVAIESDAQPCTGTPCPIFRPPGASRAIAVLELPAGYAARYLIAVGTAVLPRPDSPHRPRSFGESAPGRTEAKSR